jgi:hypothetical protein
MQQGLMTCVKESAPLQQQRESQYQQSSEGSQTTSRVSDLALYYEGLYPTATPQQILSYVTSALQGGGGAGGAASQQPQADQTSQQTWPQQTQFATQPTQDYSQWSQQPIQPAPVNPYYTSTADASYNSGYSATTNVNTSYNQTYPSDPFSSGTFNNYYN